MCYASYQCYAEEFNLPKQRILVISIFRLEIILLLILLQAQGLAFTFTLSYDNGQEEFQGTKLNRFGMQEMVENISYFTIRPPERASYRLIIYAKDLDQQVMWHV